MPNMNGLVARLSGSKEDFLAVLASMFGDSVVNRARMMVLLEFTKEYQKHFDNPLVFNWCQIYFDEYLKPRLTREILTPVVFYEDVIFTGIIIIILLFMLVFIQSELN